MGDDYIITMQCDDTSQRGACRARWSPEESVTVTAVRRYEGRFCRDTKVLKMLGQVLKVRKEKTVCMTG